MIFPFTVLILLFSCADGKQRSYLEEVDGLYDIYTVAKKVGEDVDKYQCRKAKANFNIKLDE